MEKKPAHRNDLQQSEASRGNRMSQPESGVVSACYDYLLYRGALVVRVNSGSVQPESGRYVRFYYWQQLGSDECIAGISDIIALIGGTLLAVECKSPDRRRNGQPAQPSPEQARFLAAVRERGGVGVVVDCLDDLIRELEKRGY